MGKISADASRVAQILGSFESLNSFGINPDIFLEGLMSSTSRSSNFSERVCRSLAKLSIGLGVRPILCGEMEIVKPEIPMTFAELAGAIAQLGYWPRLVPSNKEVFQQVVDLKHGYDFVDLTELTDAGLYVTKTHGYLADGVKPSDRLSKRHVVLLSRHVSSHNILHD